MQYSPTRSSGGATPTVAFETLGCKLNQYESDSIATELVRRGYTVTDGDSGADVYVVNSCTVTNKADRKSRNTLNRAVRRVGDDGVVILTGCFVDSHREALVGSAATYVVDNTHKNTIPELLDAHFRGEVVDPDGLDPNVFGFAAPQRLFHTRTTIKVQDGCDNFCTFCIIPFVRGRARSRPPREVLAEAREAIRGGARELVLTGVNMSRYAVRDAGATGAGATGTAEATPDETGITDFAGLVRAILDLPGDFRLRISSLEPDQLGPSFVDLFRHPRMCPHLHLCLQSGSDRVLLAMRRMYTVSQYLDVVRSLRELDPEFTITTDLIVGFPGEGDEEFAESLTVVEAAEVSHVHMFPYSVRSGTRAERMPGHVEAGEKARRGRRVQEAATERKRRIRERFVGRTVRVLVERCRHEAEHHVAEGFCEYYHPVTVTGFPASMPPEPNTFVTVRVTGLGAGDDPALLASPVE